MSTSIDSTILPQFFITRIVGGENLPDVEIISLPSFRSSEAIKNLDDLEQQILSRRDFETIGGSSIMFFPGACLAALHQAILDAMVREEMPWDPAGTEAYANQIYGSQPIPLMNSPLTGASLGQLVTAAGGGAAFMAAFPDADARHVTLYFLLIGGTRIVIGAADGVSIALKQGLSHLLLKWMGVPTTAGTSRKRKAKPPNSPDQDGTYT